MMRLKAYEIKVKLRRWNPHLYLLASLLPVDRTVACESGFAARLPIAALDPAPSPSLTSCLGQTRCLSLPWTHLSSWAHRCV